jgi:hypothetical protein
MTLLLDTLRQTPQPGPARFLAAHPGCWIQYYDDTGGKDPGKALSTLSLEPDVARRKQQQGCAVCYSLQAFGETRTGEGFLCFRNLGVDVDLVAGSERRTALPADIDRRKEEYLGRRLLPFPLKPHWLVETRGGFHIVFRVLGLRKEDDVREALAVNRRLVAALGGDQNAVLLTQVMRVPGTWQFKDPRQPFLCRLLLDNASTIVPYDVKAVGTMLDAWEVFQKAKEETGTHATPNADGQDRLARWREGLRGVAEGQRNATAAAIVGKILGRLPEELWETAGWGGLKEWNRLNTVPLPEAELRAVFQSIARRERTKRGARGAEADPAAANEHRGQDYPVTSA